MQTPINAGFGERVTAEEIARIRDLHGKTALITGGHSGIGFESTRVLARSGARIIVGARDMDKAHTALAIIPGAEAFPLDLSDPASIQALAERALEACDKIDILMNNAGIMDLPRLKKRTSGSSSYSSLPIILGISI
jgi:NAD(P)-dependent dehydrogenase (short-subunit alcohol dehydrogenase family)